MTVRPAHKRAIFFVTLAGALVAALVPSPNAPAFVESDKVNHIIAFAVLSVQAAWAFPRAPLLAIAAAMAVFGGIIEGLQAVMAVGRSAEWGDWRADVMAAGIALIIVAVLRACIHRRPSLDRDDIV